jgi:acetyltransferase-like isoleucine patch superfamily enzyme
MFFKILKKLKRTIGYCYRFLFYFLFNNIPFILSGKLICNTYPDCYQRFYLTGEGIVTIGDKCYFGNKHGGFNRFGTIEIQPRLKSSKILIGSNVMTNNNVFFCAAKYIEVGDFTLIGQNVSILDHDAHGISPDKRRGELGEIGEVRIGNNVWIGNNVTILKNSIVGDNTIIATGAVVAGKFPGNVIIGGIPARIIKKI